MKLGFPAIPLFLALVAPESLAENTAAAPGFDHSGIRVGTVTETCYREPCSVAKVLGFEVLPQNTGESRITLILLGGTRPYEGKAVSWNEQPHGVIIDCSVSRPSVATIGRPPVLLPLGSETGVPGVLTSAANLYLKACHNTSIGNMDTVISTFGYKVEHQD